MVVKDKMGVTVSINTFVSVTVTMGEGDKVEVKEVRVEEVQVRERAEEGVSSEMVGVTDT